MRSTFAGLSIAQSGLFASQRSLDITGHNIANANTRGYSRQRLNQSAANPLNIAGGKGQLGIGVDMKHITQIRDEFMDIKYRDEMTVLGEWEEKYMALTQIESIFNEPTDNGIRKVLDNFYQGLHDLSQDPASPTARAVVLQSGVALAESLSHINSQFEKMVRDINAEVESTVTDINSIADQIARLNKQIYEVEVDGSKANDLRDARNVLIDDLSKLIDIQVVNVVEPGSKFAKVNILVQGTPLVAHDKTNKIDMIKDEVHPLTKDGQLADPPRDNLSTIRVTNIQWESGAPINQSILKGILGGQLSQRDNFEGENKGIPYYIRSINEFARGFAKEFNDIHELGTGLNGDTGMPVTGKHFCINFGK
ncbi:flagellar hook-associated protein 1 FlgK [Acetoanaerobium pronyense]|uniref:Flagellar hook-associated protein 1 n=1 Tax=Acetoanaerobium pronyense TaxID=1482736 RepID=A0ABS4KNW7_9FIRM|nr:flagellar hook-associated protein FlgK [Acetoanaerobium pronyense]MBP2029010.1 flagellar hook-associated protein 1 FlgK [Acetoanaerobium pronyense]